ncbi:hypothetical protein [Nostoc sp.]|uniref:hypothetical protein n=1 Tax=Nostoc sp. TaxID=1180 RepID=UPI002FF7A85E
MEPMALSFGVMLGFLQRAMPVAACSVSHPNYRQTTIYIDKVLYRHLLRSLEDSGFDGDFSKWVEQKMKSEIESQEKRSQ